MRIDIPSSLKLEHEELHKKLKEIVKLGGKTSVAAKKVEKLFHSHLAKEEKHALPPLGLLHDLAAGKFPEKMGSIVDDIADLKEELPKMLVEHQQIIPALRGPEENAQKEDHTTVKPFVESLILHSVMEEQVMYPAAVVVGELLKLKNEMIHAGTER